MNLIKANSYSIYFSENGYTELENFISNSDYSSIFILVDDNTLELCYPLFMSKLRIDKPIEVIQINAGEEFKNIDTCTGVWNVMTELGADRKSLLITLGGGVIGDLGGFVAATYKRGIDFVNIPTTLLSMVDSSVGGKTGIDIGALKNQVGVFANPKLVLIDSQFLETLSPKEIRSGTAEIIKYGLTYDAYLYNEITTNDELNIIDLIHRSVAIKNEIVTQDPKEQNIRKILNFGHTIGHAVESYFLENTNKEKLTHGEAIAIGMICECYISSKELNFPIEKTKEIKENIIQIYGKVTIEDSDLETIINLLKHDKKNVNGNINFTLLKNLENSVINCETTHEIIVESLLFYKN